MSDVAAPPPRRTRARRTLLGRPLATGQLDDELLPKRLALPIFSSDALSSVAYATEAALAVLVAASLASRDLILPVSAAIALLLIVVVLSYRQTIEAYPQGGGAYIVARENLGTPPALVAAASLLVDYVLTVAVSIAAGSLAITSAAEALRPYALELSLGFLVLLLLANLRGLREAGTLFALPTYIFILAMFAMLAVGLARGLASGWPQAEVPDPAATGAAASVGVLVILRSFASGCSALTGVEAIANGVKAFQRPQPRNANVTLSIMGTIAVLLFAGVSVLAYKMDALPSESVSLLSEIGKAAFGPSLAGQAGYYVLQAATFAVLVLAANTAFQGFPRLAAVLAHDAYAPRQLQNLGDRLVFSNGIVLLTVLAGGLLVAFDANVEELIHLYLLGVFTAFTLSQAGMVVHWVRAGRDGAARRAVAPRLALNAVGAAATGLVAVLVIATKFTQGAWMVVVLIPVAVFAFWAVKRHYRRAAVALSQGYRIDPGRRSTGPVLLLADEIDAATQEALAYGRLVAGRRLEAVHVPVPDEPRGFPAAFAEMSGGMSLAELHYGEDPEDTLVDHLRWLRRGEQEFLTLVLPERVPAGRIRRTLHPGELWLRLRLLEERGVVVTSVPALEQGPDDGGALCTRMEVLLAVGQLNDATLRALDYAIALRPARLRALHIALGDADTQVLERKWAAAGLPVDLEVISSPFRDLGQPLLGAIREMTADPRVMCNVVMPEIVLPTRRHRVLHNQRALFVKRLLLPEPRTVVTSVPLVLPEGAV